MTRARPPPPAELSLLQAAKCSWQKLVRYMGALPTEPRRHHHFRKCQMNEKFWKKLWYLLPFTAQFGFVDRIWRLCVKGPEPVAGWVLRKDGLPLFHFDSIGAFEPDTAGCQVPSGARKLTGCDYTRRVTLPSPFSNTSTVAEAPLWTRLDVAASKPTLAVPVWVSGRSARCGRLASGNVPAVSRRARPLPPLARVWSADTAGAPSTWPPRACTGVTGRSNDHAGRVVTHSHNPASGNLLGPSEGDCPDGTAAVNKTPAATRIASRRSSDVITAPQVPPCGRRFATVCGKIAFDARYLTRQSEL